MRALRLRWWDGLLLCVGCAVAVISLLAEQFAPALVLIALNVIFVGWRAQIPERNVAGGYARTRALLLAAQWASLLTIYVICVVLSWVMQRDHWTRDHHGRVAFWLLVGFGFFLIRETMRVGEHGGRWWRGSEMEREVARRLEPLRAEGWLVIHDLPRDTVGGNVDHYVSGPTGAFAIETKSGGNRAASRNQAVSSAVWAREKLGERRFVTGILCVGTDPPNTPLKQGHAWVLGVDDLVEFVRTRR